MKIAFATSDRVHVNAHFGWAQEADIYEISDTGYKFIETLKFAGSSNKDKDTESEDKTASKIEALADCTIVYVASIGGIPAAKLIKRGIMPVRPQSDKEEIISILNKLVQTLKGNPPPWLRKAIQKS
ncbi:nitrogen fixation protein NifX [Fischerella thermalis CCMEE 5198]|jgi:nitrogen fixation protein NifX|uniref:nitrogen fixation protein NifX n=1 Tax=Fischerella thermalis TaxID=372787 RepID=UPI000C804456|nr:nitrogen fixation protein NifX [Fischerella thermalis]PLZ96055.1 nitrogen fixation protein NifX [Fischerella thermalis CCMEE 5196]PMB21580.1 nitrogen fixation protein NifX [Fischerella thermalis CCMEE 5198]